MTREKFLETVTLLTKAAEVYYSDGSQIMTDAEYDHLLENVETAAAENNWTEAEELLNKVAAGFVDGKKTKAVTHSKPMLSMAKVKTLSELETFAGKIGEYSLEPKLDGLAVSLTYVNGKLVEAATRGDGVTGETILAQVVRTSIHNLPHTLPEPLTINVRGELYMTHKDFEEANLERKELSNKWRESSKARGGETDKFAQFLNPRNATAGIIRNEKNEDGYNPNPKLSFAAYDSVGFNENSYVDELAHLKRLGFVTAASLLPKVEGTLGDKVESFKNLRDGLDFPVDGIVLKASSIEVRRTLGEGSKTPNWSMAYKYNDEQKITRLLDIEVAVNRTGAISYTAIVEPVELEGTTVSKATLNNTSYIADNNIRIGGNIIIEKANQIIPRIVSGVDNSAFPVYIPQTTCPKCGEDLDTESSLIWRCLNTDCSLASAITYWATRDAMDIDGLGEALVDNLIENGHINSVADLYKLTLSDIEELTVFVNAQGTSVPFGNKRATELVRKIQESKTQPLYRVLAALNIRFLGRRLGKALDKHFGSIEALQNATVEELSEVDMLGSVKAEAVFSGLIKKADLLKQLKKAGLTMVTGFASPTIVSEADWISGKKFVITGSFEGYNRDELTSKLESFGGVSSGSVSSSTDILICGEKAGSKKAKAESLNIRIIEEAELKTLIG